MAYKRVAAVVVLLGALASAQALVFGAGSGELNACGQDVFTAVNDVRAANGAPAIEPLDSLIRMAQFKADNLASDSCKVYNNEPYLHYACTGEGCNTCSNAASLWLSGLSFGGPQDLDAARQGTDKFSYELLTSPQNVKMGCATAAGWSGDAPCSVTVCYTGANVIKTKAKAEGKPDISFWLTEAAWVMPSNRVGDDKTDECPGLALKGLCGAGYQYTNAKWSGILGVGADYWVSVDQMCPGSCPASTPAPKPAPRKKSKKSKGQTTTQRRMMIAY